MKMNRKRTVIVVCAALCIVVAAVVTFYRPKRHIVIELEGPTNLDYETVIIVDGQREEHTVTLPKTFKFYAREVSYRVTPRDTSAAAKVSGHMYTEDKLFDFSTTGSTTSGRIKSPSLLGRPSDFEGGY